MNSFAALLCFDCHFSSRSLGANFFVIMLLALVMSISGFLVEGRTTERANNHRASSRRPRNIRQHSPKLCSASGWPIRIVRRDVRCTT